MLSIHPKVKEIVTTRVKRAIGSLEKSDFDPMMGLATRLLFLPEAFPNPDWDTTFFLASFVIGGISSHAESEFKDLDPEEKAKTLEDYSELLTAFNEAIQTDNAKLVDDILKIALAKFYEVFGP